MIELNVLTLVLNEKIAVIVPEKILQVLNKKYTILCVFIYTSAPTAIPRAYSTIAIWKHGSTLSAASGDRSLRIIALA